MFPSGPPRKIALIRIGKIGDLIVTNFAIRRMRLAFPDAHILLVTSPINRELMQYSKDVDEVCYYRKGADLLRVLLRLRLFKADLLMDFNDNRSSTSTAILRFAGAREKVGFVFGNERWLTIPVPCPKEESMHISQRLRLLPESIGLTFEESEIHPMLTPGEQELKDVREYLAGTTSNDRTIIALNLSAGNPNRYWQTEKWQQGMKEIHLGDPAVVFLLLHAQRDMVLARQVADCDCPVLLPPHTSFHHFAAYISCSHVLITPDTSAVHVGCAFQIPLIGLYPAVEWNFQRWRPIGTLSETVRPESGLVTDIPAKPVIEAYARLRSRMMN